MSITLKRPCPGCGGPIRFHFRADATKNHQAHLIETGTHEKNCPMVPIRLEMEAKLAPVGRYPLAIKDDTL